MRQTGRDGDPVRSPISDEEAIRGVVHGDHEALRLLYQQHASALSHRLWRRCGDPGLVEDVLQETFVVVWQNASSYHGRGPVGAWIWGIASRQLATRLRKRRDLPSEHLPEQSVSEEWAELQADLHDARMAIEHLQPDLQETVQAVVLDGLSVREAAQRLSVPEGTIKSRMHRARGILRRGIT